MKRIVKKATAHMLMAALLFIAVMVTSRVPVHAGSWTFKGEGWYKLYPKCAPTKCLDVSNAGTSNGTNIQIYDANKTDAQWFYFASLGNGYYAITAKCSGKVLDINGGSKKSGANVHQWDYKFLDHQIWRAESAGNGYYYLKPSNNESLALDVSGAADKNGVNVQVYTFSSNNSAQMWKIWNGNTKLSYSAVTGVKSTSKTQPVSYDVKPNGDSKVTVWAVNSPLLGRGHYQKEGASRFRVKIIASSGKVLVNKIVTGKSNTFSVRKKYGQYRVEITQYSNWADGFMWNPNLGFYCQMSLKNASIR